MVSTETLKSTLHKSLAINLYKRDSEMRKISALRFPQILSYERIWNIFITTLILSSLRKVIYSSIFIGRSQAVRSGRSDVRRMSRSTLRWKIRSLLLRQRYLPSGIINTFFYP